MASMKYFDFGMSNSTNTVVHFDGEDDDWSKLYQTITHQLGKDREVIKTRGTYPWSFVSQIFKNGQPNHVGDRKTFEVMVST
jgi:hypothetical protein